jgi:RND family efflux transporter MFP subunit
VKLLTLTPTTIRDSSEYIGTLKSRRTISIQPQVEGQLTEILVKSGDVVEAGKPLMQIDPARQVASVNTAQATRASRLAGLAFARQQLDRVKRLYDSGAGSKQDLDQAAANVASAQADVDALGAQIRQNEVQLQYYRIVAPAKGVVGDIPVRVGDRVTTQTLLTMLTDNEALEAYVSVPVERAGLLVPDMEVELLDSAGATLGTGHVHFIAQQVNPETQSILIKTDIHNPTGILRAEQFVRARVVWSTHDGVAIPALAVQRLNGQTFVFVAEAGDGGRLVARLRPVTLGELSGTTYVVAAGLKAGDRVVVSGTQKIQDGVPLVEQADKPPPAAGTDAGAGAGAKAR